jgi:hypothetical protein
VLEQQQQPVELKQLLELRLARLNSSSQSRKVRREAKELNRTMIRLRPMKRRLRREKQSEMKSLMKDQEGL